MQMRPPAVRGGVSSSPKCQSSARGARPGDSAAWGLGPCFHLPCWRPCKKARATLGRMKAELYSSWLGKRTSRWSCTGPHPSPLPEPKKTGGAANGSLCSPLSFAQVEAGERRAGVAAVTGRPELARAPGLRRGGGLLGRGWVGEGTLLVLGVATGTGTELRALGHGRDCLGCAHRPT